MNALQSQVEVARRSLEALAGADAATLSGYLDDASVFRFRGDVPLAGEHKGPEHVGRFVRDFAALLSSRGARLEVAHVVPGPEHVYARFRVTAPASPGRAPVELGGCLMTRVREGHILESSLLLDDAYAFQRDLG
ncbi:nuclear transport factor 2 family protein [Corallococcus sp. CA053C]|uniref:nuclear transport factor 2 family protein n=1 Tax=Corallococcus sp. CA053C TaxID=2316732 RepID=UPI000EA391B9|nr:nuclear transport factor 2 family protein [Corallococcus sp. CA053C]RKH13336.1 nuclear transport factor 2 family protein [Corallococcus sp. CA053C]